MQGSRQLLKAIFFCHQKQKQTKKKQAESRWNFLVTQNI